MGRNKPSGKKKRLIRAGRQTRWAPFWVIPKIFGKRRIHPSRVTAVKRRWRRSRIRA